MSKPFNASEWLHEVLPSGQPRHRRLSYLITANGGLTVRGWGVTSSGDGHRRGLEQDEALELIHWSAFLDGLATAGVDVHGAFYPLFRAYQQEHGIAQEAAP